MPPLYLGLLWSPLVTEIQVTDHNLLKRKLLIRILCLRVCVLPTDSSIMSIILPVGLSIRTRASYASDLKTVMVGVRVTGLKG